MSLPEDFQNALREKLKSLSYDSKINKEIEEISKNLEADFFSNLRAHYSNQEKTQIVLLAAEKLAEKVLAQKNLEPRQVWVAVVEDFHRQGHWGFSPQLTVPEARPLSAEQKISRELFPYVWCLIQSVLIMKAIVYYFGIQTSNEPSTEHTVFFILALSFSFGSLFIFAWRKHQNNKKNNIER